MRFQQSFEPAYQEEFQPEIFQDTNSFVLFCCSIPPKSHQIRYWEQCPTGRVFQYRVGSGRVLDKIPGSGLGSGRVGVSKYTIKYFRVSFLLSGISGYVGYCRVLSGISGFTHIYKGFRSMS